MLGFTDARKRNPQEEAKNVVLMGFSMIETIRKVRAVVNFPELDMRIGIHTGKIISGVIGTEIVRYDIYGRDVMIANKIESSGEKGRILISATTRDLLKDDFSYFSFTKKETPIEIKSI